MSRTITVPEWLNESFLQTVVQHNDSGDKKIKVKSVEVTPAVAAGANYVCVLFRLLGTYHTEAEPEKVKDLSVVVKTLVTTEYIGKFFEDFGINQKEYIAYKEFLPEIYKILGDAWFTAKLLYSPHPNTLVFEDLKNQGFMMADRLKQLDFNHCIKCLNTLAKFHAASVAVLKKNPDFIGTLGKEPLYDRSNAEVYQKINEMTKTTAYIYTKAVQKWKGFEDFEDKSRRVWETLQEDLCDVFEPRNNSLNVMCHGDLWTNNMMFKYDSDGNVADIRLLDFQLCRYGTPVTDLLYFVYSSANQEVRENRLDELFSAYLETLNSVLEQMGCEERLTRNQLDAELKRCQCYILSVMCGVLGAALSDPDDLLNLDEITEDKLYSTEENPLEKCYYGKYYKDIAQQILRYLVNEGFFNC